MDFALPSSILSSQIDEFGLFEMPYLVRDRAHMRAIEDDVVWPELAPLSEAAGYRIISVWENGFRHVTNNVRPIETPADLAGVKLRTPSGVWRVKLFQALGANPTPMAFSEVFIGLQTGVIDGQENPLPHIWGSKLHEVQEYLSLTSHVYTPAYVVTSPTMWDALPGDVRMILEDEARATQAFVYETADRLDSELIDQIRASGVEVNTPKRGAFLDASAALYDEFGRVVSGGPELLARAAAADPADRIAAMTLERFSDSPCGVSRQRRTASRAGHPCGLRCSSLNTTSILGRRAWPAGRRAPGSGPPFSHDASHSC